jgi:hypothetical protein
MHPQGVDGAPASRADISVRTAHAGSQGGARANLAMLGAWPQTRRAAPDQTEARALQAIPPAIGTPQKAGSSQRRKRGRFLEASSAQKSSAGARSLRTILGHLLSSFSTASRRRPTPDGARSAGCSNPRGADRRSRQLTPWRQGAQGRYDELRLGLYPVSPTIPGRSWSVPTLGWRSSQGHGDIDANGVVAPMEHDDVQPQLEGLFGGC